MERTQLEDKFQSEWPKVLLYGDSITKRAREIDNGPWASLIGNELASFCDVDVRGFDGYNSKWALQLMPQFFPRSYLDKVEIFIPFFGHNDSWSAETPLHVDPQSYEDNMRAIIKYMEDNGLDRDKIIMITPTWYHKPSFDEHLKETGMPPHGKELEDARKYSEAILRIAKDLGIEVVDFFDISLKQEPLEAMFCDGVHYSRLGAQLLFDQLMPIIEKKLEKRFGKPLADLWHTYPIMLHPEVKPVLDAYNASLKDKQDS